MLRIIKSFPTCKGTSMEQKSGILGWKREVYLCNQFQIISVRSTRMGNCIICLLKKQHLTGENSKIASSSDLFLPGRILDTFFNIKSDRPDDILEQIAILSWLPVESVQEHFATR